MQAWGLIGEVRVRVSVRVRVRVTLRGCRHEALLPTVS